MARGAYYVFYVARRPPSAGRFFNRGRWDPSFFFFCSSVVHTIRATTGPDESRRKEYEREQIRAERYNVANPLARYDPRLTLFCFPFSAIARRRTGWGRLWALPRSLCLPSRSGSQHGRRCEGKRAATRLPANRAASDDGLPR